MSLTNYLKELKQLKNQVFALAKYTKKFSNIENTAGFKQTYPKADFRFRHTWEKLLGEIKHILDISLLVNDYCKIKQYNVAATDYDYLLNTTKIIRRVDSVWYTIGRLGYDAIKNEWELYNSHMRILYSHKSLKQILETLHQLDTISAIA